MSDFGFANNTEKIRKIHEKQTKIVFNVCIILVEQMCDNK